MKIDSDVNSYFEDIIECMNCIHKSDVYDNNDYKYENINVNNPLNIECIQDYIYVIYPADSEFMFNLTMSSFPVPMEPVDTTTIQDYYILKSVNQYDGNFNITI